MELRTATHSNAQNYVQNTSPKSRSHLNLYFILIFIILFKKRAVLGAKKMRADMWLLRPMMTLSWTSFSYVPTTDSKYVRQRPTSDAQPSNAELILLLRAVQC